MTISSLPPRPLRFLFVTLGHIESDFYGRVGKQLRDAGNDVAHVTYSRHAARRLAWGGQTAWCLPDRMLELGAQVDTAREADRIADEYDVPTFRDIYRADFVCAGRGESSCVERTVRHMLAMERIFDEWRPDIVVPEVGSETLRVAARLVGVRRGIPVLFLFYTIFPNPLRVYIDTMHAPIIEPDALSPLSSKQQADVNEFVDDFTRRRKPIREPRESKLTAHRTRMFARHLLVKAFWDRDNDYLRPFSWLASRLRERLRVASFNRFYSEPPVDRPFVYFPLHVTDDYKIERVVPHCADQGFLIEQVAGSLPHGWELVTKEHPMAIGRTSASLLKRLTSVRNVRVVPPTYNSHVLIERSSAVVVISSTVGLEALLYDKPVLTLGQPFYSGLGITIDLDSFAEIRTAVPQIIAFRPDHDRIRQFLWAANERCFPGVPVLVDRGDGNAVTLAQSVEQAAREALLGRLHSGSSGRTGAPDRAATARSA